MEKSLNIFLLFFFVNSKIKNNIIIDINSYLNKNMNII